MSSKGFCFRKIFFSIGSNFCLKLALLSLSCITYKLMSSDISFPKIFWNIFCWYICISSYTAIKFWTNCTTNILSKVSIKSSYISYGNVFGFSCNLMVGKDMKLTVIKITRLLEQLQIFQNLFNNLF